MFPITLIYATFIGSAVAQSVTSLFLPGIMSQALVGSVIDSSGSTTTYSIACPSGTDADDCGVDGTMIAIEGPHTAIFNRIDADDEIAAFVSCDLENSPTATCTTTISGPGAGHNTGTSTKTFTNASSMRIPVTITSAPSTGTSVSIPAAIRTATTIPPITSLALAQSPTGTTGDAYRMNPRNHLTVGGFLAAILNVIYYI
ncbi:hypothetical protein TMatcc_008211 [Talaromyces marneffei ATCC 18224]|uniref:GPI anchored protein n=1 Tax=Talaromyces marneffei (strain ATCC 18224 / CBS 334.59 / QM 7333) TaxID=441960 RepID=B6QMY2_TALMQ|nr:uncharacterized protein EYB26_007567 [Talaromyces marneffei]EEA22351.1 conserved hypothetical protein [Talaromyces marneffei ATCC 18224]KAE8550207.1 hypothetical protein EYB25_006428 [Talaromyces marneffei]QGA19872.1 hypothetical protein EYB26_007567 [Talaromyces marneffei]